MQIQHIAIYVIRSLAKQGNSPSLGVSRSRDIQVQAQGEPKLLWPRKKVLDTIFLSLDASDIDILMPEY